MCRCQSTSACASADSAAPQERHCFMLLEQERHCGVQAIGARARGVGRPAVSTKRKEARGAMRSKVEDPMAWPSPHARCVSTWQVVTPERTYRLRAPPGARCDQLCTEWLASISFAQLVSRSFLERTLGTSRARGTPPDAAAKSAAALFGGGGADGRVEEAAEEDAAGCPRCSGVGCGQCRPPSAPSLATAQIAMSGAVAPAAGDDY